MLVASGCPGNRVISEKANDRRVKPNLNSVAPGLPVPEIPGDCSELFGCLFLLKPEIETTLEKVMPDAIEMAWVAGNWLRGA
jgi:hypothetical protein